MSTILDKPTIAPNACYQQPFIDFRHGDGVSGMASIKSGSVKCILVDPPYLYLKGQKLEREFDEFLYFSKVHRVLRDDGFIVIFGRGASFYRWNGFLEMLGFKFKEEIIWNKRRGSSPVLPLQRVHETIAIWTKKNGSIKKSMLNYGEVKAFDQDKVYEDIKRLGGLFNKGKAYEKVISNLKKAEAGESYVHEEKENKFKTSKQTPDQLKCVSTYTLLALENGVREQSIISDNTSHYNRFHPTQKPVRLLQRLLYLTAEKGDLVVDNFAGSASSAEACAELEINWIGWEIDKEYYDLAIQQRLSKLSFQTSFF